jgi:hypothetical protein
MKPMMNNSPPTFWKYLFLLAGLFNGLAGGLGMAFPVLGLKFVTGLETAEPAVLFTFFLLCFVVSLFGLGYALVAFNAPPNRGIVVVGAIGKICFFVIALYGYLNEVATLAFVVVTIGDVIWAGLFASYLNSTKGVASRGYLNAVGENL